MVSIDKNKSYHTIDFSSKKNPTLGKLFVLGKVKTRNSELKKNLDSLIDFINQCYLEQVHPNAEEALERILQQANQEWQAQLSESEIPLDNPNTENFFKHLNLVVGILQDTVVHFAYIGRTNVLLVRKNNVVDILKDMHFQDELDYFKIFGSVITGSLKLDDILFFSFADFVDYFSTEKIKRIVTDYSPKKACSYFKELIQPLECDKAFCINIFKVVKQKTIIHADRVVNIPIKQEDDSMKELVLKQQQTQEFIKPKITPRIHRNSKNGISKFGKLFLRAFKRIKIVIRKIKDRIQTHLRKRNERKEIKFSDNKSNIVKGTSKQKTIYLPKQNKVYLILSLVLVVVLGGIITYSVRQQAKRKQEEAYQKIVSQIEEKQNLISAAMMYGDNNRAEELLGEIKALIDTTPEGNQELIDKYEELKLANRQKLDELLKLYVAELETVVELTYKVDKLTYLSGNIYTWENNTIIKIKLADKEVNKLASLEENYGNIVHMTPLDDESLLIYTANDEFVRFIIEENSFVDFEVETDLLSKKFKSMLVYSGKLYVLDTGASQIYKYQTVDGQFGKESSWITDSTDLAKLQNIVIDGYIWSITDSGKIYKLYTGEKETYTSTIKPAITEATKIYTELDWKNLYILDAGSNRIIILDKASGQVVKQYHSDKLTDTKDFIIDEENKTIHILDNTSVFKLKF